MIPWVQLGAAIVPGDGGELRLMRRGQEFSIMAGSIELMNSRLSGSEEALAGETIARLGGRPAPRLLIGGLGMGFTLRAALAVLGPDAKVVVAELVPEVAAWARGPMAFLHGDSLTDPRVTLVEGDVAAVIAGHGDGFDAILLDVDNGPSALAHTKNNRLYSPTGVRRCSEALRPGGVLAVWSAGHDTGYVATLKSAGFKQVEARTVGNHKGAGVKHVLFLASRG